MSKRCEAVWPLSPARGGAKARCTLRAECLYITALQTHRFCTECARRYEGMAAGPMWCVGILPLNDRSNPETIKALRVRHALVERPTKR